MIRIFAVLGMACTALAQVPETSCERISDIQSLPAKGRGSDPVYLAIMESGHTVVPCLIEKITDTTPMPDPRMAPSYDGVVVGDVAFFLFVRIARVDFAAMLPDPVRREYGEQGVYSYFSYVSDFPGRLELQQRCRDWWSANEEGREAAVD